MRQFWLVVGSENNWKVAFENKNIWGLKDFREVRSLWNMLKEGDGLLFYVSKPVHGIIGCGEVRTKFRQTNPLWPQEVRKGEVIWPLRFEFDIEYCLPPHLWKTHRYTNQDLQLITRMVFQCYPIEEVRAVRAALGLETLIERPSVPTCESITTKDTMKLDHDELQQYLCDIGRIQGYIADKEYCLDSTYLDVVWRRVERSVPTFVFEIQIAGDIYHAMAKLKHAFDLWNSHIFLVGTLSDKSKFQELISGTFHEVEKQMRFVEARDVKTLLERKLAYKQMEETLGIFGR